MRSVVFPLLFSLALAAPAMPQDRAQERLSFGADSAFGPGVVDFSASGNAVKLRLVRPAHVVVVALREPAVAQLVLPRRAETRTSRAGDQWIDLPWAVTHGPTVGVTTVSRGRIDVVKGQAGPGGVPPIPQPSGAPAAAVAAEGTTVTLVIASDSLWSREAISALLPPEPSGSLIARARAVATALSGSRTDSCAVYLVRW